MTPHLWYSTYFGKFLYVVQAKSLFLETPCIYIINQQKALRGQQFGKKIALKYYTKVLEGNPQKKSMKLDDEGII